MVIALASALAAPVICDPQRAARVLEDARIPAHRMPVTQPNLLPGLARTDSEVASVLEALCDAGDASLSLVPAERWESAEASAYSFVLTHSHTDGCTLRQESVVLTVGVVPDQPLTYGVRSRQPPALTPIGECDTEPTYRSEEVLEGASGPVRLVRVTDHDGDASTSRVVVRRGSGTGWQEQVLLDPAPARLVDGGSGPELSISDADGEVWIIAHSDREISGDTCTPREGQTIWRWDGTRWDALTGRDALGRLADRGLWRLAGSDGWFLILAQDIEKDRDLLQARMRRIQRRRREPLLIRESALFPDLNAGFLIVSPDPWPTEEEATAGMAAWRRRTGVYVKQGWQVRDSCR